MICARPLVVRMQRLCSSSLENCRGLSGILALETLESAVDSSILEFDSGERCTRRELSWEQYSALQDASRNGGRTAYLLVSIALPELSSMLGGEEHLADPAFWNKKGVFYTDPLIRAQILQRLMSTISCIEQKFTAPSDQAVDFFERSIIEPFVAGLMSALPQASTRSYTGAR